MQTLKKKIKLISPTLSFALYDGILRLTNLTINKTKKTEICFKSRFQNYQILISKREREKFVLRILYSFTNNIENDNKINRLLSY